MSSNSDLVMELMAQFNSAQSMADYRAAKARVESELGTVGVLAMVDTMIDTHARLTGVTK